MARNDAAFNEPEPFVVQHSAPAKHRGFGFYLITILIIGMLVVGGLYLFYYLTSPTGKREFTELLGKVKSPFENFYYYIAQRTVSAGTTFYTAETNTTGGEYGIKFKSFQSVGSKRIPAGSTAALKYVVEVKDSVNDINLNLICKVEPKEVVDGEIQRVPAEPPKVSSETPAAAENLRCVFKTKDDLKDDKTVTVKGSMSFNIASQRASLKVYMLGSKEYEKLKGADFFKVNGIEEKLPIKSVYSGEPVEVGIGASENFKQPVVVGSSYTTMVGIGLTNRWDGKVVQVNSLALFLPEGVSIDSQKSPANELCPFSESSPTPSGQMVRYDANAELLRSVSKFGSGEPENYHNFECQLKVDESLVGGKSAGFKTAYYVDVGYGYEFNEKSDVISVSKKQAAQTQPAPVPSEGEV